MKTTKKFSKIVHHNVEWVSDGKYVIFFVGMVPKTRATGRGQMATSFPE
jgi:hypothetical protein